MDKELEQFKQFEPKNSNRFYVKFGDPFNIPIYVIKEVQRPSFKMANCGIQWNDMIFTMYDPITPSTSQAIFEGLRKLRMQDSQQIKINLKLLGPIGDSIELWDIVGTIDYIDFGYLDWNSGDPLNIKVNIKVLHAILQY